jgi:D-aspartate ligase
MGSCTSHRMPPAVIVGLDCITGLQTARILAARGVPVIGVAANPKHFCCRTKVCRERVTADIASERLIESLVRIGNRLDVKAVLYPCTDLSVLIISRYRDELASAYHIALPEHSVVEMLTDKVRFFEFAQREGLAAPATHMVRSRADLKAAIDRVTFPCLLKPPVKTTAWTSCMATKVCKAESAAHLMAIYERCQATSDVLLVQDWIEGTDAQLYSCNCYFNARSEPVVTFVARKLRQWPPETGTSCLGEECRNDVVLHETIRLFRAVRYRGLGYVEMKRDVRTGRHWIIEPNIGRPTGRSAIAEAGGVELLYSSYCDAVGWDLPEATSQTYGNAKWIYWRRDFQSALYYWYRSNLTLADWGKSWRGRKTDAVFSWSDPAPFMYDCRHAVGTAVRRLARKLRNASTALLNTSALS